VGKDGWGRPQAAVPPRRVAQWLAFGFVALVAVAVAFGRLPRQVLWSYLGASVFAFLFYAADKSAARRKGARTSENGLLLLGLLGGWPGALVAQTLFRHKIRKASFQMTFWCSVVLNVLLLLWFLTPDGGLTLQHALARLGW
jgi:uncharacterized membrane protein YsdA (DUF1294 family)